jgi:RsiW-degrading membrane proteinase PrsW (M82 family)
MVVTLNEKTILFLVLIVLIGLVFGVVVLLLPLTSGEDFELTYLDNIERNSAFTLSWHLEEGHSVSANDSPYYPMFEVKSPKPRETDTIILKIFSEGRHVADVDCLGGLKFNQDNQNIVQFTCLGKIPYTYTSNTTYEIYGIFSGHGIEYISGPLTLYVDWADHENDMWELLMVLGGLTFVIFLFVILPIAVFALRSASCMKHENAFEGEYSFWNLFHPMHVGKTMVDHINCAIASPYFWGIETLGILVILIYMATNAQVWQSDTALIAFVLSGLLAFVIPFLWCIAWWYSEYTGREPLRLIITFFLWGMLAALMAVGINTVAGAIFALFGLAILVPLMIVPAIEEFYKGAGLGLLSEHHEYKSMADGLVFGFVIGMGYSFIENWLYLMEHPLGSDLMGWISVFIARSLFFSANHGIYTALIGGAIGYLKEIRFNVPVLGIFLIMPLAAFFHAVHNSSETLIMLLGADGFVLYLCFLMPLFNYGGLFLIIILFVRSLLRKSKEKQQKTANKKSR